MSTRITFEPYIVEEKQVRFLMKCEEFVAPVNGGVCEWKVMTTIDIPSDKGGDLFHFFSKTYDDGVKQGIKCVKEGV